MLFFDKIKLFLLDCDGVIWRGNQAIEGSIETINYLYQKGYKVYFVTNNSTLTKEEYRKKFSVFGLNVRPEQIITSAYTAAYYVHTTLPHVKNVYIIGETGLVDAFRQYNYNIVENTIENRVDLVVVGMDRQFTYKKLYYGMHSILYHHANFIATNLDPTFPLSNDRLAPGAGAMIAALERCTNMSPQIVIGKPNVFMLELIFQQNPGINPKDAVIIGDRLTTDIQCGINYGIHTILVESGIDERHNQNLEKTIKPDLILGKLYDLITYIK